MGRTAPVRRKRRAQPGRGDGHILDVPLVVVAGPTATGKSALGVALAQRFPGEIVSADSRQVYRGMDIGTGKELAEARGGVPHHLIDVVDPDARWTLADDQRLTLAAIRAITKRGRVPFLVGGTGLYISAVTEGWQLPEAPPLPELRAELEARVRIEGVAALHAELAQRDPEAAAAIDGRNPRRVIRALEVIAATGRAASAFRRARPPAVTPLLLGLTTERAPLHELADRRIDGFFARGFVAEVRLLLTRYPRELPALSAVGYREVAAHIAGEISVDTAIALTKQATHAYQRRQLTWFRARAGMRWLDVRDPSMPAAAAAMVERYLSGDLDTSPNAISIPQSGDPEGADSPPSTPSQP